MFLRPIRHAIFVVFLVSQLALTLVLPRALPEKRYLSAAQNALYVTKLPGATGGIGGIYPGAGFDMTNVDMGNLALAAATDAITAAIDAGVNIPLGVTVYISGNRDLIIGAIGGGTGSHGEQQVQAICRANNLEFVAGSMVTYTGSSDTGFIPACGTPGKFFTDNRECWSMMRASLITDKYTVVDRDLRSAGVTWPNMG